jgi:phenylacetate-CoA ligase
MAVIERSAGYYNQTREIASVDAWRAYHEQQIKDLAVKSYPLAPAIVDLFQRAGIKPADIASIDDLKQLPVTTKSDLARMQAENPPFGGFLTVPVNRLKRIFMSPGPIYDPQGQANEFWGWSEGFYAAGFRPNDVVINTFGYQMTPAGLMFEESLLDIGCCVIPTGVGNTETQVKIMQEMGVTGFVGMASFLRKIGETAIAQGLDPLKDLALEIGYVAAEILTDTLRSEVEGMFGMRLRQGYGTADCGCLAYECSERNGMHFTSNAYIEILDPRTREPMGPGEPGEVVVTLFNSTYPLVRFATGDLSAYTVDACACGRTAPRLTKIMGRVDQVTKVKGMFVHPQQAQAVIAKFPQVAKFQIVVTRANEVDNMTFKLEMAAAPAAGDSFYDEIAGAIQEGIKLRPQLETVPPGTLAENIELIVDERVWDK